MRRLIGLVASLLLLVGLSVAQIPSDTRIPQNNGFIQLTQPCVNVNSTCDTAGVTNAGPLGTVQGPMTVEFNTQSYGLAVIYLNGTTTAVGAVLNFEFSDDGGTSWYSNICTRTDVSLQEAQEAIPAATFRAWECSVGASTRSRVRLAAITSGVVNVSVVLTTGIIEPAPTIALAGIPWSCSITLSTSTTTQCQPLATGLRNYITSYQIYTSAAGTGTTVQLETGTGANCASSPVAFTPAYPNTAITAVGSPGVTMVYTGSTGIVPPSTGLAVCAVQAGATPGTTQVVLTGYQAP